MDRFHAEDTPINLAINNMFNLLQHHVGATCEPRHLNMLTKRIYQIMNDKEPQVISSLMKALSNSIYCAITYTGFNYEDALAQINHDIEDLSEPETDANNRPSFTREQEDWLCYQIGEWYLEWRECIADYASKTHSLGYAKEKLKERLCSKGEGNDIE